MPLQFHRDYLVRLPLPLAQLYCRAYNAKDPRARHDNTFYLFESLIKLAACPLIAGYLDDVRRGGKRVEALDHLLGQLSLPSLGQWAGFVRELSRHFGERPDAESHPLGHLWRQLNEKHAELPGMLALYRRIKNGPDGKPGGDQRCSVLQLIESLVQYRNAVFGHGASRAESFYEEEMGPLLFPAADEMLKEGVFDLLGPSGTRLVYLAQIQTTDAANVKLDMLELIGLQAERLPPMPADKQQAANLVPNQVAVLWPQRDVPMPLDPLLLYRESDLTQELLFLNRDRNGKQVEFLSYTTGRTERDKSMAVAMNELLSLVSGPRLTDSLKVEFNEDGSVKSAELIGLSDVGTDDEPIDAPQSTEAIFGDFEIQAELGRGGMGVVYLARQLSLGRPVALKVLPKEMAKDEVTLARFQQEISVLGHCEHPNIVKILASGTLPNGQLYYAMEYVLGADLERVWQELSETDEDAGTSRLGSTTWNDAVYSASLQVRQESANRPIGMKTKAVENDESLLQSTFVRGDEQEGLEEQMRTLADFGVAPLPQLPDADDQRGGYARRIAGIVRDAARALQTVHEMGVVHRDIKPSNLVLTADGSRVVLMDFGLVKGEGTALTTASSGGFLGTLRYAAPEQLASATLQLGPAADVRALGVTTWELLTRKRLFADAHDEVQLAQAVHEQDVPLLSSVDPAIDPDLEAIVARATERRVSDRIQTAQELADYLDLYLAGKPVPLRTSGKQEQLKRWVGNNRALTATGSIAVVALILMAWLATQYFFQQVAPTNDEKPGSVAGAGTTPKFRIATSTFVGYAPIQLAQKKGFYDGIDVEIIVIDDRPERRSQLVAGEIDAAVDTVDAFTRDVAEELPIKAVLKIDETFGADGIVAREEINSIAELKGKSVAYVHSDVSHFFLLDRLAANGISIRDIKTKPMEADEVADAFINGKVDAVVTWEPDLSRAAAHGKILATSAQTPGLIVDIVTVNENFLEQHPEAIQEFAKGWFKAIEFIKSNPAEAHAIMADSTGHTPQSLTEMLAGIRLSDADDNRGFFLKDSSGNCKFTKLLSRAAEFWAAEGIIGAQPDPKQADGSAVVLAAIANRTAPGTGKKKHDGSANPIKIGILHSLSGTMAGSETEVVNATKLAIAELNQGDGLLGRSIVPIVVDGQSDPKIFAQGAERLIVEDKVCTIFGCWTSASRKAVRPVVEEHNHLLIYPVQYEGLEQSPNIFYTGAAPNQQIIPAVRWCFNEKNSRKFFLVGSDYVFPRAANEIMKDELKVLGGEVVGEEYLLLGSTKVESIVAKISEAQPDIILNTINGDSNIAFFHALRAAGVTAAKIPTMSFSISEHEIRNNKIIKDMAGDYAAWNYFQTIESDQNKEFISKIHAELGPIAVTDPMEAAYFGVHLWANAVAEANTDDVNLIRARLRNQTFDAPHGKVRIDAESQHTWKTARIGRINLAGQFDVVWVSKSPEKPIPYPLTRTTEDWKAFLFDLKTGWGGKWSAPN